MMTPGLISRIAVFSALIYVVSWGTVYLPNVNLVFFLVFSAGFLWGPLPGAMTGLIGMGLWSNLHPFGPALIPIMIFQTLGAGASGLVGAAFRKSRWNSLGRAALTTRLVLLSFVCTALFFVPVSAVDAWLFGPFWPRFLIGLAWSLVSLVSNALIFPLLFPVTMQLYNRECTH